MSHEQSRTFVTGQSLSERHDQYIAACQATNQRTPSPARSTASATPSCSSSTASGTPDPPISIPWARATARSTTPRARSIARPRAPWDGRSATLRFNVRFSDEMRLWEQQEQQEQQRSPAPRPESARTPAPLRPRPSGVNAAASTRSQRPTRPRATDLESLAAIARTQTIRAGPATAPVPRGGSQVDPLRERSMAQLRAYMATRTPEQIQRIQQRIEAVRYLGADRQRDVVSRGSGRSGRGGR